MSAQYVLPQYLLLDRGSAERLRKMRWTYDITLQNCAEALAIDVYAFLEKERGRTKFAANEFTALASLFDIAPETLYVSLKEPRINGSLA